jgi:Uma2 family endonuclease
MKVLTAPRLVYPPSSYLLRRFSVDEYHRMIDIGVLTEEDPVELLEGWIVQKMARNPPHDGTIQLAGESLRALLPRGWLVRVQSGVTTTDSEPEPDLAVVPGPAGRFLDHHPGPAEIALIIEVADASLQRDREDKGRLYARAGIRCYWIINLVDRQVEVYTEPTRSKPQPRYRQRRDYHVGDAVPLVVGKQAVGEIEVHDLLPPE